VPEAACALRSTEQFFALVGNRTRTLGRPASAWSLSQSFVSQNTVGTTSKSYRFFQSILPYAFLELKVKGDSHILTFYVLVRRLYFNFTVNNFNSIIRSWL